MNVMRRFLGVLVMIAGTLGLVLSLAGLVMVWVAKPTVKLTATSRIAELYSTIWSQSG